MMEAKNRMNVDWSEHVHTVEVYKGPEGKEVRIDSLAKPGTVCGAVHFINAKGIMSVTGDYGNWIFCRPFIPSKHQYVSDGYWIEKLMILSKQKFELDMESIEAEVKELVDKGLEDMGYEGDRLKELKEWFGELDTDDELSYLASAFRPPYGSPAIDYEMIPHSYKTPVWLEIVFDAFDELCRRVEENEKEELVQHES